jgi:23S rRNA pseudouridine2605 synthase
MAMMGIDMRASAFQSSPFRAVRSSGAMAERLQKILSRAGVASRRAAEQLITTGRVSVNGVTVSTLGAKADPDADDVRVDGRRVRVVTQHRYLLLHKPRGYVTTRSDPQGRPTVLDLLQGVREYLYPVGRLDYDTEGLLLLTNDGDLAAALTHPRHGVERTYEAEVDGTPDDRALARLRDGLMIDGRRTRRARVTRLPSTRQGRVALRIVIREGRNRQVRKMCDAVGCPVRRLVRTAIGGLRDRRLRPGQWRDLTEAEVRALRTSAEIPSA